MDRQELIQKVAEDLFVYVMHGSVSERRFVNKIKYSELDERFDDFASLVDLHFILRPEVVKFVESLPQELRSIKTQTRNIRTAKRGEITGRIDWESTVKRRSTEAPGDRSLFVCNNRYENYDIDENIVLKRLLSVIHSTLDDCEQYLQQEYNWVTDRWRENLELVDQMRNIFERNVHVTRIKDPEGYEPTDRMIQSAEAARNDIYRTAAALLREHRAGRSADETAIKDLLEATTVTPDDEETLFELYVLFQYVRGIESHQNGQTTVATIESGRQEVARITNEDGTEVVLYHDSAGSDRSLSFVTEPREKSDEELTRSERIPRETRRVVEQYFANAELKLHTNRPDVIVLEIRDGEQFEYLITEVKCSSNPQTIRRGVKETLEYLAFLRREDTLVFSDQEPFGNGWSGVLVVQDLDGIQTTPVDEQSTIRILQASELDEQITTVINQML